jgi:adenine-specific DNA-methyltransferase
MGTKKYQKVNLTSSDLSEEKLAELNRILPEVFSEDKIDWQKLKAVLGADLEPSVERFNFTWAGKANAVKNVLIPSRATLKSVKSEGIKFDESENIFIEGDNLEALKLLQKAYFEQIKVIYIDPPYNSGDDFVYNDDFIAPLRGYLEQTGQIDNDGNKLQTNRETNGRYHSDWLSMMYPRLKLAWNLLRDDGVIFISISDIEVHHLRMMMDEIFGEENFEGHIHWRRRPNQPNDSTKMIGLVAEHILVYAKNSKFLKTTGVGKVELTGKFSNPDNDKRGDWASKPWKVGAGQSGTKYIITTPTGKVYDEEWMGDLDNFNRLLADNRIIFPDSGSGSPRKKYFKKERQEEGQCASNWWDNNLYGSNQDGSAELFEIFGQKNIFSNPKPVKLIKNIVSLGNVKGGEIVLDFFAGSATTAQAVFALNQEDGLSRKFILVQLPELLNINKKDQKDAYEYCAKLGKPTNIAELSKERIRRVVTGYGQEPQPISDGFKVFKLAESNYPENNFEFDPEKTEPENQKAFLAYLNKSRQATLFSDTQTIDVVYENIIKEGLSLNAKIEKEKIADAEIYKVIDDDKRLMVCLDKKMSVKAVKELTNISYKGKLFVCLDNALDDTAKANLALNVELKTI